MQDFMTISIEVIQKNYFELLAVILSAALSRSFLPKYLVLVCSLFIVVHSYFYGILETSIKSYERDAIPWEVMRMDYNAYYVMCGLTLMCLALALAFCRPLQSKTAYFYCIALCIASLSQFSMFANGLEVVTNSGNVLFSIPDSEFIRELHRFINNKMIIITVVIAWISVVLSWKGKI